MLRVFAIFFFLLFQEGEFPGFVPLIKEYLNDIDDVDIDTSCTILQYLNFISKRASGRVHLFDHIIFRWVHRESYLMFTLSSGYNKRKMAFAQCKLTLSWKPNLKPYDSTS